MKHGIMNRAGLGILVSVGAGLEAIHLSELFWHKVSDSYYAGRLLDYLANADDLARLGIVAGFVLICYNTYKCITDLCRWLMRLARSNKHM